MPLTCCSSKVLIYTVVYRESLAVKAGAGRMGKRQDGGLRVPSVREARPKR